MDMVTIPGAEIALGCGALEPKPAYCKPAGAYPRVVRVEAFAIGRLEVTTGEYQQCVDAGRCSPLVGTRMSPRLPAMVNWDQATAYCQWQGARLPTDAEWELAARGTDRRTYPWGERAPTCEDARFPGVRSCVGDDPANRGLVAGGQYPNDRSPFGVMDMAGNAAEWTADPFTSNYNATLYTPDQPEFQRKVLRAEATFELPCCPLHTRVGVEAVFAMPAVAWRTGFRCAR